MPGSENESKVTPISYTSTGEDGKVTPGTPPTPTPRTSTPKKSDESETSQSTNSFDNPNSDEEDNSPENHNYATINQEKDDGEAPSVPPKNPALLDRSRLNLEAIVPPSPPSKTKDGPTLASSSSKDSLESGIGSQNPTLSRSPSQETVFSPPWKSEILEDLQRTNSSSIPPTGSLPSYTSAADGSKKSLLTNSKFDINDDAILKNKKTNRIWPRAKYAMQQKSVIIFGASAIILGTSAALVYLQDKEKFIAFFTNSPKYITIPVIALAALLAISPIFCAIRQFRDTAEHKTQGKDANEILAEVLENQPKDKVMKSVRLEYSNGTHSNFTFNAWKSKNGFINIDEKVVSRTNKIESVINNRPLFTALLTGVVAANVALPLLLYAEGGVNNVQKFYQNPLTNNIGLSLLIGSGILALSIICLGVHYYRKTNCTNLIYSQEEIDIKDVNEKFIQEIKNGRIGVLKENHSKEPKCLSLTLEQVVVQSHNCKDAIYNIG